MTRPDPFAALPPLPSFSLVSDSFADGEPLPRAQTMRGGGHWPQLAWQGFPDETRSFLLTCIDMGLPKPLWHWIVADVPVTVTSVPQGPSAWRAIWGSGRVVFGERSIVMPNAMGLRCFLGASPPPGAPAHDYVFTCHALDVHHLNLPKGRRTPPALIPSAASPHTLARASLIGRYRVR